MGDYMSQSVPEYMETLERVREADQLGIFVEMFNKSIITVSTSHGPEVKRVVKRYPSSMGYNNGHC
jgi:hypothetical protein